MKSRKDEDVPLNDMKIELERGVDNILFGMTESNIIGLMGPPNKIVLDGYGNRDLIYNELKLVLKIELENSARIGWIEVQCRTPIRIWSSDFFQFRKL